MLWSHVCLRGQWSEVTVSVTDSLLREPEWVSEWVSDGVMDWLSVRLNFGALRGRRKMSRRRQNTQGKLRQRKSYILYIGSTEGKTPVEYTHMHKTVKYLSTATSSTFYKFRVKILILTFHVLKMIALVLDTLPDIWSCLEKAVWVSLM